MLCRISRNRLYRFHYNNRQRSHPLPIGDPVGIQTQDLQNRNLTLYSAKLPSQRQRKSIYNLAGKQMNGQKKITFDILQAS